MTREPRYPQDAAIGDAQTEGRAASAGQPSRESGAASAPEQEADGKRTRQIMTGAAIGIGSAAIVAALLYANRRGKPDRS